MNPATPDALRRRSSVCLLASRACSVARVLCAVFWAIYRPYPGSALVRADIGMLAALVPALVATWGVRASVVDRRAMAAKRNRLRWAAVVPKLGDPRADVQPVARRRVGGEAVAVAVVAHQVVALGDDPARGRDVLVRAVGAGRGAGAVERDQRVLHAIVSA